MPAQKRKRTSKKKKDPNAPKRPLTAYMIFSQEHRQEVREENKDAKIGEISKILGERWKKLSDEEKKVSQPRLNQSRISFWNGRLIL